MDRETAAAIHKEITSFQNELGKKFGIQVKSTTFRYSNDGFKVALEGKDGATSSGVTITTIAQKMAQMRGLDPIAPNHRDFVIADYNSRAHRTPWIVQCKHTGKRYRMDDQQAEATFKAHPVTRNNPSLPVQPPRQSGVDYQAQF